MWGCKHKTAAVLTTSGAVSVISGTAFLMGYNGGSVDQTDMRAGASNIVFLLGVESRKLGLSAGRYVLVLG